MRYIEPRQLEYRLNEPAMVWAVDEFHAPHYFLPRVQRIASRNIEFRITPSLLPLRDSILASTVNFSMIRMKYANQA